MPQSLGYKLAPYELTMQLSRYRLAVSRADLERLGLRQNKTGHSAQVRDGFAGANLFYRSRSTHYTMGRLRVKCSASAEVSDTEGEVGYRPKGISFPDSCVLLDVKYWTNLGERPAF